MEQPQLNVALLARAGAALYGQDWQSPLARHLGVSDRTIRRMVQAAREGRDYTIPPGWWPEVTAELKKAVREHQLRAREAAEVGQLLEDAAGGG